VKTKAGMPVKYHPLDYLSALKAIYPAPTEGGRAFAEEWHRQQDEYWAKRREESRCPCGHLQEEHETIDTGGMPGSRFMPGKCGVPGCDCDSYIRSYYGARNKEKG
jgi:hypothetical protein